MEQHGEEVCEEARQRLAREYLDTLLDAGDAKLAASLCPKLLGERVDMWVEWVPRFREAGRLGDIIPHIPVHSPRLPSAVYEGALRHLIHTDPPLFLATLRRWPLPEAKPPPPRASTGVANDGSRSSARAARRARVDESALFSVPALLADLQREVKASGSEELRCVTAASLHGHRRAHARTRARPRSRWPQRRPGRAAGAGGARGGGAGQLPVPSLYADCRPQ